MEAYLTANHFLTSLNNEIPASRNETYSRNLASIKNLVLVLFTEDKTVVPKESAWFGAEEPEQDARNSGAQQLLFKSNSGLSISPMRLQPIYLENWIGLRELDERGGIVFEACKGEHMQMGDCWEDLVHEFVGGAEEFK
jgi:palmitoyl-protein thioesterase